MTDDLQHRAPGQGEDELPAEDGLRSDQAGTGTETNGPAPAGGDPDRLERSPANEPEPPDAMGAPAGGGYGTASDRPSSGGAGDGETTAGDDPQTDWLRSAPDDPPR